MTQLTLIARLKAKPGMGEALGAALLTIVAPSRAEPGCINYDLHRSDADPDLWCVYENWRSKADHAAHDATPHIEAFRPLVAPLLAEPVSLEALTMVSTPAA